MGVLLLHGGRILAFCDLDLVCIGHQNGFITGQYGGKLCPEISPWCGVVLNWYWNWVLDLVVKLVVWWCMTCISQEWYQNLTKVQQAMCQSNT